MFVAIVFFLLFFKPFTTFGFNFLVPNVNVSSKYKCFDKERQALLLFKAGITDDRSGLLSSWSSKDDNKNCCKWRGVECSNQTGHVIKLHLKGTDLYSHPPQFNPSLTGKISPSLLQLRHLNSIDLSWNDFSKQPIPKFIGSLTKLKYLDLSYSNFAGTIPSQLGNLSDLQYLDLSNSDSPLVSNLEWLSHLSSLEYLSLNYVDLSTAIQWVHIIKSLPLLSHVRLFSCQLSRVVHPSLSLINSSTSITTLDLSSNDFTKSMYHWLFNLSTSVVNLSLSYNQLKGPIPDDFGKMTSLSSLDLSGNQLKGPITDVFGKLTSLAHLDLSSNELGTAGIPKSLGNLCSLQSLFLSSNNISGNLADFLHNVYGCAEATLEWLYVGDNKLTGSLPDSIVRFSSLKYLNLRANQLNGTVSENLGTLAKLISLDLSSNSLQGILHEAHLLNLSSLSDLYLSFTSLGLDVSSQWIPRFQLEYIGLNSCKIGPRFPEWIQTQKNLYYLDIANCGISENIPAYFWDQLTSLTYINLSTNQIRGKLPHFPSNFYNYPKIDLSSNLFEGQIPMFPSHSGLINLSRNKFNGSLSLLCQIMENELIVLDLSHNLFTGALPDCLMQFRNLVVLSLAHNQLTGKISTFVGSLFNLQTLNLYNNNFFGELPLSLGNCTYLRFLDLGKNNFTGNIPPWVGENMQIYALNLGSNNFSGIIPLNLCYLRCLQILDLSLNNFFGRIPPCLNNLTSMIEVISSLHVPIHEIFSLAILSDDGAYRFQYHDYAVVKWQGKEMDFRETLGLLKIIDLSSNQLTGQIPEAITFLQGLNVLDLSSNKLNGEIPKEIGQMKLLSLNLSRNEFSGNIPVSMSTLSSLESLDLSHNSFSGRIPIGTQLQSFDPSSYIGNYGLCGLPLTVKCPGDELPPTTVDHGGYQEDGGGFWKWFYIGGMTGFITGFWGICGALFLNRSCRHVFFRFIDNSKDWLYVKVALHITKLQR